MSWEMYEVVAVFDDGYEEVVDTTTSIKHARELAKSSLEDGAVEVIINHEVDDSVEEVERIT